MPTGNQGVILTLKPCAACKDRAKLQSLIIARSMAHAMRPSKVYSRHHALLHLLLKSLGQKTHGMSTAETDHGNLQETPAWER